MTGLLLARMVGAPPPPGVGAAGPALAFVGGLSPMHWALIGLVALLLFGNRLPQIARKAGRAITEFKRGLREVHDEIEGSGSDEPPRKELRDPKE